MKKKLEPKSTAGIVDANSEKEIPGTALVGDLTAGQVDALKKKHGSLFMVTVGEGEEKEYYFFKRPTMGTLSAFSKFADTDPIKAAQIVFNDCLLRGRPEAVEEPETFLAIMPELKAIMKKKAASIKEL